MADLFGLSPADRETLMRMIARERANYTADVRSLAPVPRPRVIYKMPSQVAVAGMADHTAITYTAGSPAAAVVWATKYITDSSLFSPAETSPGSAVYDAFEISEPMDLILGAALEVTASWSITSESSDWRVGIYNAFDAYTIEFAFFTAAGASITPAGNNDSLRGMICGLGYNQAIVHTATAILDSYPSTNYPIKVKVMLSSPGLSGSHDIGTLAGKGRWWIARAGNAGRA